MRVLRPYDYRVYPRRILSYLLNLAEPRAVSESIRTRLSEVQAFN